jgi:hypothetical protein
VFDGLRHDAIDCGHTQKHGVHASGTGDHGSYQALVAGHVYEGDRSAFNHGAREAERNRDASRLFFSEGIKVLTSQRCDERGFSVVNVPGSANDWAGFGHD